MHRKMAEIAWPAAIALALLCAAPVRAQEPTPTETPTATPTTTPTPALDYYPDGDYGVPGRLFDLGIILAFGMALIDFIGPANLRDWVGIVAGFAAVYAVLAGAAQTSSGEQQ